MIYIYYIFYIALLSYTIVINIRGISFLTKISGGGSDNKFLYSLLTLPLSLTLFASLIINERGKIDQMDGLSVNGAANFIDVFLFCLSAVIDCISQDIIGSLNIEFTDKFSVHGGTSVPALVLLSLKLVANLVVLSLFSLVIKTMKNKGK